MRIAMQVQNTTSRWCGASTGRLLVMIAATCACRTTGDGQNQMNSARKIFETELEKRGVAFKPGAEDGVYRLRIGGTDLIVNTENISRNYRRDGDARQVVHFVDQVVAASHQPPWVEAKSLVFFSAEPSDGEFGDAIRSKLTDTVDRVLVVTNFGESKVSWVTPAMLEKWRVSREDVENAASGNMAKLLTGKSLEIRNVDNGKLGMVPVDSVFKASVIFAPTFKAFVSKDLGWPVLAVLPARDFIYVLAEKDKDLLGRMGRVVVREYGNSGYPITTEVLRISDDDIAAIGNFPH